MDFSGTRWRGGTCARHEHGSVDTSTHITTRWALVAGQRRRSRTTIRNTPRLRRARDAAMDPGADDGEVETVRLHAPASCRHQITHSHTPATREPSRPLPPDLAPQLHGSTVAPETEIEPATARFERSNPGALTETSTRPSGSHGAERPSAAATAPSLSPNNPPKWRASTDMRLLLHVLPAEPREFLHRPHCIMTLRQVPAYGPVA